MDWWRLRRRQRRWQKLAFQFSRWKSTERNQNRIEINDRSKKKPPSRVVRPRFSLFFFSSFIFCSVFFVCLSSNCSGNSEAISPQAYTQLLHQNAINSHVFLDIGEHYGYMYIKLRVWPHICNKGRPHKKKLHSSKTKQQQNNKN